MTIAIARVDSWKHATRLVREQRATTELRNLPQIMPRLVSRDHLRKICPIPQTMINCFFRARNVFWTEWRVVWRFLRVGNACEANGYWACAASSCHSSLMFYSGLQPLGPTLNWNVAKVWFDFARLLLGLNWKATTKEYLNHRGTKIRVSPVWFGPLASHPFPSFFPPSFPLQALFTLPPLLPSSPPLYDPFFWLQENSDLGTPLIYGLFPWRP